MVKVIHETQRTFSLARYVAHHQQVLFRSARGEGGSDRVDIVFRGAQYINLSTLIYEYFTIYRLSPAEFASLAGRFYEPVAGDLNYYGVGGSEVMGLVAALTFDEHHDDKDEWDPSEILEGG